MSRFRVLTLALPMLATACKVAPTPREYFDHQTPAAVERQAVAEEVQDRVLAMAQALNRGDLTESMIALAPGPDASVITPLDSTAVQGADEIAEALRRSVGGPVEIAEVEV